MLRRLFLVAAASAAAGGCSGFLPEGGPSQMTTVRAAALQVGAAEEQSQLPFVLVSPTLEMAVDLPGEPERYGDLPRGRKQEIRARVGDLVLVTIFEAGAGGLFTNPQAAGNSGGGGNYVNLPAQAVSPAGTISIPYAGTVNVAGRNLTEVQREIEGRLKDRAIEPQVIVTLQEERASVVSVMGSVRSGGQFPVRNTQFRILDAIARAGGTETTDRPLEVVLQRGRHTSRVSMRRLVSDPSSNTIMLPGDTVYVYPINRAVNIFGASGENTRIEIEGDRMNLSDTLGRAKGFADLRADVASIFVLRMEDRRYLPPETEQLARFSGNIVPTVYQIRYDTPGGIFIGNQFKVRHGDVIYISNASGTQVRKLLELVGLVTRPVRESQGVVIAY